MAPSVSRFLTPVTTRWFLLAVLTLICLVPVALLTSATKDAATIPEPAYCCTFPRPSFPVFLPPLCESLL